MWPPFNFVDLVEVQVDFFAGWGGGCFEGPGRFIDQDGMGEIALKRVSEDDTSRLVSQERHGSYTPQ